MCACYELKATARALNKHFRPLRLARHDMPRAREMQPHDTVLMITATPDGYAGSQARWGLVGSFLNAAPRTPLTTLHGEGLSSKPFYGKILGRSRCLIPATAFHEWQRAPDGKQKMRISHPAGEVLMFAGIFDHHPLAGTSCAIITTAGSLHAIDRRQPLILGQDGCRFWLAEHPEFPVDTFETLLQNASPATLCAEAIIEPEPSPQLAFVFA